MTLATERWFVNSELNFAYDTGDWRMICEQWTGKDKKGGGRGIIDVIFLNLFGVNKENK